MISGIRTQIHEVLPNHGIEAGDICRDASVQTRPDPEGQGIVGPLSLMAQCKVDHRTDRGEGGPKVPPHVLSGQT